MRAKTAKPPHRIAVVVFDDVVPSDVAMPCDLFSRVELSNGRPAYELVVCGGRKCIDAGYFQLRVPYGLEALVDADTVIVPGARHVIEDPPGDVIHALRSFAARGGRVASICTGAFVLASAGLLDGRRATTHWMAAGLLAERHPQIAVDPNALYVDEGQVLTSAGASAGMDLCLHLVRRDYGASAAAQAARLAVAPLGREGGQAQYIAPLNSQIYTGSLQPLMEWMLERKDLNLTISALARQAKLSTRTLNRRFHEQTGLTPMQWLVAARVDVAKQLLETSDATVEQIAGLAGFGSAFNLRRHFLRLTGTSPQRYRSNFGAISP